MKQEKIRNSVAETEHYCNLLQLKIHECQDFLKTCKKLFAQVAIFLKGGLFLANVGVASE